MVGAIGRARARWEFDRYLPISAYFLGKISRIRGWTLAAISDGFFFGVFNRGFSLVREERRRKIEMCWVFFFFFNISKQIQKLERMWFYLILNFLFYFGINAPIIGIHFCFFSTFFSYPFMYPRNNPIKKGIMVLLIGQLNRFNISYKRWIYV